MRLNRVLLLAATISMMMFALVFTISCSGDDGKDGKNGTSCTMQEEGSDWNIICGGEEVGTIHGGDGKPGSNGTDGTDGDDCWLNRVGTSYEVRCGAGNGQVKGNLDGCGLFTDEENKFLVTLTCGKSEVNLCRNEIFDPTEDTCDENCSGSATSCVISGGASVFKFCGPANKAIKYNEKRQYCGYGKDDNEKYQIPATVYNNCGKPGDPMPNLTEYNEDEYCRHMDSKTSKLAGLESGDYCNGKPLNKDGWKTEYCGYASNEAKVKSVITGICDAPAESGGPQGPNEVAFGQGYCEVKWSHRPILKKGVIGNKTTYSENLCGTSENNKPNNGTWKDEYCGYASGTSADGVRTKVYSGICDDTDSDDAIKAPNMEGYNQGYCMADRGDTTKYTNENFCNEDPTKRPNDGKWKGEYCGYENETAAAAGKVYAGICDDDQGPNADGWNPKEFCEFDPSTGKTVRSENVCENGDKINEYTWKSEYCGYGSKNATQTSKQVGVCDTGEGPNSVEFGGGYCTVPPANRLTGKTEYTDEFCGTSGKVNEGKWNSEYCGYASGKSEDNDKVWKGACDDGDGKNKDEYGKEGYCQAASEGAATTWSTNFCDAVKKSGKYNEDGWKGQYCYPINSGVNSCPAGMKQNISVASNHTNRCVLPSTLERCNRDSLYATNNMVGGLTGTSKANTGNYSVSSCIFAGRANPDFGTTSPNATTYDLDAADCEKKGIKDGYVERTCTQVIRVARQAECDTTAGSTTLGGKSTTCTIYSGSTTSGAAPAAIAYGNAAARLNFANSGTDSLHLNTMTTSCKWDSANKTCTVITKQASRGNNDIKATTSGKGACNPQTNTASSVTTAGAVIKSEFTANCVFTP